MESLPDENLVEIGLYLGSSDICTWTSVCKRWYNLTRFLRIFQIVNIYTARNTTYFQAFKRLRLTGNYTLDLPFDSELYVKYCYYHPRRYDSQIVHLEIQYMEEKVDLRSLVNLREANLYLMFCSEITFPLGLVSLTCSQLRLTRTNLSELKLKTFKLRNSEPSYLRDLGPELLELESDCGPVPLIRFPKLVRYSGLGYFTGEYFPETLRDLKIQRTVLFSDRENLAWTSQINLGQYMNATLYRGLELIPLLNLKLPDAYYGSIPSWSSLQQLCIPAGSRIDLRGGNLREVELIDRNQEVTFYAPKSLKVLVAQKVNFLKLRVPSDLEEFTGTIRIGMRIHKIRLTKLVGNVESGTKLPKSLQVLDLRSSDPQIVLDLRKLTRLKTLILPPGAKNILNNLGV